MQEANKMNSTIKLDILFSDNAVVQRNKVVPVWGTAEPNHRLSVKLGEAAAFGGVSSSGKFRIDLPAQKEGGPYVLEVKDLDTGSIVRSENVMVGEVWLSSGQSNMSFRMSSSEEQLDDFLFSEKEDPSAVRTINVSKIATGFPEETTVTDDEWILSNANEIGNFSAVGFWFARDIAKKIGCTVGILNSSWGGTVIDAWTSREKLMCNPYAKARLDEYDAIKTTEKRWVDFGKEVSAPVNNHLREHFRKYCKPDIENLGFPKGWARPDFDDSTWENFSIPGDWTRKIDGNGIVWIRRKIDIPAKWAGKDLVLRTAGIDKTDITYFNGEEIGRTGNGAEMDDTVWDLPRKYVVPGRLVKAGENLIAIRAYSFMFGGAFGGATRSYQLVEPVSDERILFSGSCLFKAEAAFGRPERYRGAVEMPLGPKNANTPYILFDSMIRPVIPYAINGFIWYQGESNCESQQQAREYEKYMTDLIDDWRYRWCDSDLPFGIVQIAAFSASAEYDDSAIWPYLRASQTNAARKMKNVGIVSVLDVGDASDIHPKDKRSVGKRLAAWALRDYYGVREAVACPMPLKAVRDGAKLIVTFDDGGAPLTLADGPSGFYIAGDGDEFKAASAELDGNKVVLQADAVSNPVKVRYAWADYPLAQALGNAAGQSAVAFELSVSCLR